MYNLGLNKSQKDNKKLYKGDHVNKIISANDITELILSNFNTQERVCFLLVTHSYKNYVFSTFLIIVQSVHCNMIESKCNLRVEKDIILS